VEATIVTPIWRRLSGIAYYLVLAAAAALCILTSLGFYPGLADPAAQAGEAVGGGWRFGPDALQHAHKRNLIVHVPRSPGGAPLAIRLAALHEVHGQASGLRLVLRDELADRLAGRAVVIEAAVRPLEVSTAQAFAVRVEGPEGAMGEWVQRPLSAEEPQTLRFALAAPAAGLHAIWVRPVPPPDQGYAYGVELAELRLRAGG